jgi:hypothetical protein
VLDNLQHNKTVDLHAVELARRRRHAILSRRHWVTQQLVLSVAEPGPKRKS